MIKIVKLNFYIRLFFSLLLITSPWILLLFITKVLVHHSIFNSIPCWSDELAYWHEILSFSQKGFDFGYYTFNEAVPQMLSFGSHGFGTVSVYALFGKIFGWKTYSIVLANAFFMSLAFLFLLVFGKVSFKKLLTILFVSLTFTPLVLFSSTSMTELLSYSMLIIYFTLLYRYYFKSESKKLFVVLVLFCIGLSFVRIIYILLFLPMIFKTENEPRIDFNLIRKLIIWLLFSIFLYFTTNLFVSPYPDSFLHELFSGTGFISKFLIHFAQNSLNFISPFSEIPIQVLQRYFVLCIIIFSLFKSKIIQNRFRKMEVEYFAVFLILISTLLVTIAAYDVFDWRDYRVLAPVLFGCIVFLILNTKKQIALISLIFNTIGIILLISSPQVLSSFNAGRYEKLTKNNLLNSIEYIQHANSKFENTVIVKNLTVNTVLNVPAGIGISCTDKFSDNFKSNYIFSDKEIKFSTYKLIRSNKTGYLYRKELR